MKNATKEELISKIEQLQHQLTDAQDTIDAIRTGQVDALVVNGTDGHTLYTLRSADLTYRVFVEQMSEGALTLSADGMVLYSNSKFSNLTGAPLSSIIGQPFSTFVGDRDRAHFQELFHRGWREIQKSEIHIIAGDDLIPVQVSMNVLLLDTDVSLSLIITDLRSQKMNALEMKLKNEQLLALNKALTDSNHDLQQFASVASHDLQEPLRKIQVFSKFLKDRSYHEISEASQQYVEKIIKSSNRMKTLIVDILTYSRLSADQASFEEVDLNVLISEILEDLDLTISEKNAVIELDKLCVVEGNKGQLRQVFNNLIGNALKFAKPGEYPMVTIKNKSLNEDLVVSLKHPEKYCRIAVRDNGIGFDQQFASSIFSLFEKLNPKTLYEGSGIGLAIAKKIVDKHRGLIIAKSAPEHGAEFNVILPYRQTDFP